MLNPTALSSLCRAALAEDVGRGDATTAAVVPDGLEVSAVFVCREACVCAGLPVVDAVFRELDPKAVLEVCVEEGRQCEAGTELARITGDARALLTGERTALNFLQRLSGIATVTRRFVDAVRGRSVEILDTRKTTPGLRKLEKYAVRMGGGQNHRFGLYDRVMIKDNHRILAALEGPGAIHRTVAACRRQAPGLDIEVEADTIEQVAAALEAGADIILLDNMSDDDMAEAVRMVRGRAVLEASGGITLERVAAVADTGVDCISVGALTHSAPAVDISMQIELPG
ncbi:MAG: carboxylating nicotinate-nucleotide diphosphorylase [Kiritimatiellaeota bacterium]|nr:carboxylating nicotinate-nucleotide diphosphorylase [Kiritimatiellota bacterium]